MPKTAVNGCWADVHGGSPSRRGAGDQMTSFVTSTESVTECGTGPTPASAGVPSTVIVRVPVKEEPRSELSVSVRGAGRDGAMLA